jgi:S1-C subfamily serine protease
VVTKLSCTLAFALFATGAAAQIPTGTPQRDGVPTFAPILEMVTPAVVNIAVLREVLVTLKDNRRLPAKLVGADPGTDIAVVRVDPKNLVDVKFGDSDALQVGDFVIAIGNPFGLGQTATSGIVSALGRSGLSMEGFEHFIQTDASINPGNSGGALVNLKGSSSASTRRSSARPAATSVSLRRPVGDGARRPGADRQVRRGKARPRGGVQVNVLRGDNMLSIPVS